MNRLYANRQRTYLEAVGSRAAALVRSGRREDAITFAFELVSPELYFTPLEARAIGTTAPTRYEIRRAARHARTILTLGEPIR